MFEATQMFVLAAILIILRDTKENMLVINKSINVSRIWKPYYKKNKNGNSRIDKNVSSEIEFTV